MIPQTSSSSLVVPSTSQAHPQQFLQHLKHILSSYLYSQAHPICSGNSQLSHSASMAPLNLELIIMCTFNALAHPHLFLQRSSSSSMVPLTLKLVIMCTFNALAHPHLFLQRSSSSSMVPLTLKLIFMCTFNAQAHPYLLIQRSSSSSMPQAQTHSQWFFELSSSFSMVFNYEVSSLVHISI